MILENHYLTQDRADINVTWRKAPLLAKFPLFI